MWKKSMGAGGSSSTIPICPAAYQRCLFGADQALDSSQDGQFLKDSLTEARWFLRGIESCNETLMRVAMTIVDLQQGFLDHGPVAMKPMVLSDIASKLELHESTVSRVTTSKYLATQEFTS